jgi:hypothetical protein
MIMDENVYGALELASMTYLVRADLDGIDSSIDRQGKP